jgi:pimeloyl-ACP methyl ester carboxylesterase
MSINRDKEPDMLIDKTMIAGLAAAFLSALSASPSSAQSPTGDWLGAVTVSPALVFPVAVHIHPPPHGDYVGTLDSPNRGVYDLALSHVAATPAGLSFDVAALSGHYAGQWDAATSQAGQPIRALNLTPGVAPPAPTVTGLDGDWDGTLQAAPGVKLRLAFHIKTGPHGTLATVDSVDQGANGLPVSGVSRAGSQVHLDLKQIAASFQGELAPSGQAIAGQWTQMSLNKPLVLTRRPAGQAEATLNRPQTPVKPYPYREEEVVFDNPSAHVRLAGTLTLPRGEGPFPVVVLIAGSGPNTRNEPIFGHQIFLVLADHLTRQGVAVLRYDKRGTGASTGDYAQATTLDFADDVQAGMAYLKSRKDIDPRHIGLIGHSEGGLIAPMVAARDPSTAFIVMMAGPGVNGADILMEQGRLISKAMGMDEGKIEKTSAVRAQMIAIVRAEKDSAKAAAKLRLALAQTAKAQGEPDSVVDAQISVINSEWFRFFFDYDPASALSKVRCPVLAINGSLDLQVPPAQNLPAIRAALAGDRDVEIDELPGLNHLFQTAKTGSLAEYAASEETIAPLAMDVMTHWILKHEDSDDRPPVPR